MRTRWNRCSHIRFECFVLTQKNARKLNKSLMASLKPTNSPHAGTSSDGRWALAPVRCTCCQWMGNDSLQMWANACFKRNPFNLTLLTQIILNKLLLPNATQLQTCTHTQWENNKNETAKKAHFQTKLSIDEKNTTQCSKDSFAQVYFSISLHLAMCHLSHEAHKAKSMCSI